MTQALVRRARSLPAVAADAALACALTLVGELEVATTANFPGNDTAAAIAIPLMTLPLAWRRRAPAATFAATYAAYVVQAAAGGHAEQSIAVSITLLVAIYSIAAHAPTDRLAVAGLVIGQLAAWLGLVLEGGRAPGDYAFSVLLGGGAWLGGYAVRSGRLVAVRLEHRARQAEEQAAAEREQAIAEERARIAREMHDVVAHTMSVIVVQTGAARHLVRPQPERSEEMLLSVEKTGREALSEMRRLLGLIRSDAEGLGIAPQPGMSDLGELVSRARESGLELTVEQEGEARPLPPGVDLAAYRIAQEAITNALKHGGGGAATLTLRHRPDGVEIELRNAIAPEARNGGGGGGHGLIGMQERAALYGGAFDAGTLPSGDFRVWARLPLDEEAR